jgi:hypothetical protein
MAGAGDRHREQRHTGGHRDPDSARVPAVEPAVRRSSPFGMDTPDTAAFDDADRGGERGCGAGPAPAIHADLADTPEEPSLGQAHGAGAVEVIGFGQEEHLPA